MKKLKGKFGRPRKFKNMVGYDQSIEDHAGAVFLFRIGCDEIGNMVEVWVDHDLSRHIKCISDRRRAIMYIYQVSIKKLDQDVNKCLSKYKTKF